MAAKTVLTVCLGGTGAIRATRYRQLFDRSGMLSLYQWILAQQSICIIRPATAEKSADVMGSVLLHQPSDISHQAGAETGF